MAGKDFKWPDDNRVSISFSQYSNESYLMKDDASHRLERTVGNPMHIAYLFGVTDKAPLGAGSDKIFSKKGGAKEVPVELVLLPLNDPLYTAWIPMGNIEKLGALGNLVQEGSTRDRFLHLWIFKEPGRLNGFLVHQSHRSAVFCTTRRKFSQLQ